MRAIKLAFRRARRARLGDFAALLRPSRVDQLLYYLEVDANVEVNHTMPPIERVDAHSNAGIEAVDNRVSPYRVCYFIRDGTAVVHESWLCADVGLPADFGFESSIPVVGYCTTAPTHRGRHLYPQVLRHIAADVNRRGVARGVFILVAPENRPSIKGIERSGAQLLARLRGIRFIGTTWNRVTGKSPD